jgi:hypothetical protein
MRLRSLLAPLLLLAASSTAAAASNLCTTQRCVVYASSDTDLYTVDPATLNLTHQCTFSGLPATTTGTTPVTDIAVATDGTVFGVTEKALYRIDPATCATTLVSTLSTSTQKWVCLAFTAGGTLVAADNLGDVATIDPSSGAVTPAGSFNGYGCSGDIIAVDDAAQTIYASATDPSCVGTTCDDLLVTLDAANGYAAHVVGHIGARGVFGLGYWASNIYGYTHSGAQLKIDPLTGNGTLITQTNPAVKFSGGATTPLAPTCQNLCPSGGATQCQGAALQTCQLQPSGCLDWTTNACGTNLTCSGGACVLACSSQCVAGQLGCTGSTPQSCAQGTDGCWHWVDGTACGSHQVCASGSCAVTCSDACTLSARRCAGALTQVCNVGSSGCTEWQTGSDCGGAMCVDGACCGCVEGAGQCTNRGALETCTAVPGSPQACPQYTVQSCASGACDQATCLTRCDADAGFSGCGPTASCITTPTGTFCGTGLPDGGWVPVATGGGIGSSSGSSGSVGATGSSGSSSSSGSATGSTASSSGSGSGSGASSGSSASSSTSGSGSGSGSAGGSTTGLPSSGTGGSSGRPVVRTDGKSTKPGCGCGAGGELELSSLLIGLLGVVNVRARRRS